MTSRSILSYSAVGDGKTDNGAAFRAAFTDESVDEIVLDATPSGAGYAVDVGALWKARGPLPLRSGMKVRGEGWSSRIVQTGEFVPGALLFANRSQLEGNSDIVFDGVCAAGRFGQYPKGVTWVGPGNPSMHFLRVAARYLENGGRYCEGLVMNECQVRSWPGIILSAINTRGTYLGHNVVERTPGGGLIFRYNTLDAIVEDNSVLKVCDDAIAFNAIERGHDPDPASAGRVLNCTTRRNVLSRFNPAFAGGSATGPVYSVRGGQVASRQDRILPSPGAGYSLLAWTPVNAFLGSPTIQGTAGPPIEVSTGCKGSANQVLLINTPSVANRSPKAFKITYR